MSIIEEPLISIIVPVYNVELYIDACLDSIKQQTYKNIEIIVVEDCSTDSSMQVLQFHLKDERVKLIQHERNSGLSAARNTGIEAATGEYMMFVDSDDIIDLNLVESCVNCAIETGAELITYGFTPFEDGVSNSELLYPSSNRALEYIVEDEGYFNLPHFAWLKFIRTSVVRSASLSFPVGLYYEDWPFHWHLGLSIKNKYHIPVGFYLYRQRGTSITSSKGKKLLDLFIIHSQVMTLVKNHEAHGVKNILANKIRQSHWSILTRIDPEFLVPALKEAKETEKSMQVNGYKYDLTVRNTIISTIVRAPNYIALPSLQLLRNALRKRAELKAKKKYTS
ncbi:glycosyltransferase family 2 protein [Psychrobacter frigidicola]|uniref:glycosyltransferase family 2 protein n=1 Tax=Psychrobacter frigidicola TaxID=45611 RepID=UPI0019183B80|nr:glycosyltransferase family 2 protein [Psychrobacter frigidicola]